MGLAGHKLARNADPNGWRNGISILRPSQAEEIALADLQASRTAAGRGDGSTIIVTWSNVTAADTCHPVQYPEYGDRSVHVYGTFDGARVQIQGSNNGGVSFTALADPTETTIQLTTERIKAILENTDFIMPVISGGGGAQSLGISILFHLTNPLRQ